MLKGWKTYLAALALVAMALGFFWDGRLGAGWALAVAGVSTLAATLRSALATEREKLARWLTHRGGQVERR